jgi:MoaA/NifB/PqqE/SkfB family radical SAM enzyme
VSKLFTPDFLRDDTTAVSLLVDPERVRWIGVDRAGADVLESIRVANGCDPATLPSDDRARLDRFLKDCARRGFVAEAPFEPVGRRNRRESLAPDRLHEFWVVTNDHCNLRCRHCYTIERVKAGLTGLPGEVVKAIVAEAHSLGTEVFYFTGGEPTLRHDFVELAEFVLARAKLVLFTNGHFLDDVLCARLARHKDRLVIQVSIDGHDEATSRRVRGKGAFDHALAGVTTALRHGLRVGVSTTPNGVNHEGVAQLTERLAALRVDGFQVDYHHLILLLDRGGAHDHADVRELAAATAEKVLERSRAVLARSRETLAETRLRLTNEKIFDALATHGPAKDYCGSGYTILGVAADGQLLPCAAAMDDERFFLGSLLDANGAYPPGRLRELWLESPAVERLRRFTLAPPDGSRVRDLRYFHGGGCWKNMPEPGAEFATGHPFAEFYERQMWAALRRAANHGVTPTADGPRLYTFQHAAPRRRRRRPGALHLLRVMGSRCAGVRSP